MRISDWSSDVCSSDLVDPKEAARLSREGRSAGKVAGAEPAQASDVVSPARDRTHVVSSRHVASAASVPRGTVPPALRSEERRVGKECVRKGSYRWSPDHS